MTPDGAAEEAGLLAGDVLLNYNGEPIVDMQSYSNFLRQSAPGDKVSIEVLRVDEQFSIEVFLKAR